MSDLPVALQLGWRAYQGLATLAAFTLWPCFLQRLRRRGRGESFGPRLGYALPSYQPRPDSPPLWLHGVSVGEIAAAQPLVQELTKWLAPAQILISTGTETGQTVARRLFAPQSVVFYAPLDWPFAVRRYLQRLQPKIYAVLETELWPDLLLSAHHQGIRLALLNARLSCKSLKNYLKFKYNVSNIINLFSFIAAGSDLDASRFLELGAAPDKVIVTGSSKFARSVTVAVARQAETYGKFLQLSPERPVFLAASTHPGEEELALAAYCNLKTQFPALQLWLAPRHPERAAAVAQLVAQAGLGWQSWRQLQAGAERLPETVLLIDTVGDLFALYGLADLILVGGSLVPHGGQNILEPAAWGKVPVYGPYLDNFLAAHEILEAVGAGLQVTDLAGLIQVGQWLLSQPQERRLRGERGRQALVPHHGAARRQAELLQRLFTAPTAAAFKP